MILNKNTNNSLLHALEVKTNSNCPWVFDEIKPWCLDVVRKVNPSIKIHNVSLENLPYKEIPSDIEFLKKACWIGEKSPFFGKNHETQSGDLVSHPTSKSIFYTLKNVFILNFYDFGPIVFNTNYEIIEALSTPFYPLIYLEDSFPQVFKSYDSRVFAISDRFTEANYAHWLLDTIPRILGRSLFQKEVKTQFLCNTVTKSWQNDLLFSYGVDVTNRIELKENKLLYFNEIIVPFDFGGAVSHPANKSNRFCVDFICENVKSEFDDSFDILLVERSSNRKLINQIELVEGLANKNLRVKVIDCAHVPFFEQRDLFSKAKVVIAVHGAALANSVFMQPNSTLFEVLPKSYCNPAFWMISSAKGVNYYGITDVSEVGNTGKPRETNIRISNLSIKRIVELCCNS